MRNDIAVSSSSSNSCGTVAFDADFSTDGVEAVLSRCKRLKPCSLTRNEAIEDLPAQMPWTDQNLLANHLGVDLPPQTPISILGMGSRYSRSCQKFKTRNTWDAYVLRDLSSSNAKLLLDELLLLVGSKNLCWTHCSYCFLYYWTRMAACG